MNPMKQFKKHAIFITSAGLLMLVSSPVFAALVPCGNAGQAACTLCDLFVLGKNIIDWLIEASILFGSGFFAWGALKIMTAGGSENKVTDGRKMITTAVIGILIVTTAWIFIGTLLQFLTGSPSKLPWSQIQCSIK